MKYRICALSELVSSPYNPPQRTDKGISSLATNIRKNDLLTYLFSSSLTDLRTYLPTDLLTY